MACRRAAFREVKKKKLKNVSRDRERERGVGLETRALEAFFDRG